MSDKNEKEPIKQKSFTDTLDEIREALQRDAEPGTIFHPDTKWEMKMSGPDWEGEVRGFAPTQGYGKVNGLPWYYRSRHGEYRFSVSLHPDDDPIDVGKNGWNRHGDSEEPELVEEAWATIQKHIKEFQETNNIRPETRQLSFPFYKK